MNDYFDVACSYCLAERQLKLFIFNAFINFIRMPIHWPQINILFLFKVIFHLQTLNQMDNYIKCSFDASCFTVYLPVN